MPYLLCQNRDNCQEGSGYDLTILEERRQRFMKARNYIVYYGQAQEDALSAYDIAIVEPAGQTEQTLGVMQRTKTLIFAYVSITEMAEYDPFKKLLSSADYLKLNDA